MEFDRDTIVQMFLVEADEHLSAMEEALLSLESHPDDPELLDTVFRAAHTVKGNAASVGFVDVADFAHRVEDLLERLRRREVAVSGNLVTLLLECVDALRQRIPDAALGADAAPRAAAAAPRMPMAPGVGNGAGSLPHASAGDQEFRRF